MSGPCTYRNSVQVTQQLNYNNLGVRDGYIIKPKNTKEYGER